MASWFVVIEYRLHTARTYSVPNLLLAPKTSEVAQPRQGRSNDQPWVPKHARSSGVAASWVQMCAPERPDKKRGRPPVPLMEPRQRHGRSAWKAMAAQRSQAQPLANA